MIGCEHGGKHLQYPAVNGSEVGAGRRASDCTDGTDLRSSSHSPHDMMKKGAARCVGIRTAHTKHDTLCHDQHLFYVWCQCPPRSGARSSRQRFGNPSAVRTWCWFRPPPVWRRWKSSSRAPTPHPRRAPACSPKCPCPRKEGRACILIVGSRTGIPSLFRGSPFQGFLGLLRIARFFHARILLFDRVSCRGQHCLNHGSLQVPPPRRSGGGSGGGGGGGGRTRV